MSLDEVQAHFKQLGLRRAYRAYQEPESRAILIRTRRPAQIVDGQLHGSEIDLYDASTFRVWTSRKKMARALAARCGLRVRLLDGEAELFVPASLADALLPAFGAITRREPSLKQLAALKVGWAQARNRLNLRKGPRQNEVPAIGSPGEASHTPPNPETPVFIGTEAKILGLGALPQGGESK